MFSIIKEFIYQEVINQIALFTLINWFQESKIFIIDVWFICVVDIFVHEQFIIIVRKLYKPVTVVEPFILNKLGRILQIGIFISLSVRIN